MQKLLVLIFSTLILFFVGCNKHEGEGGTATIKGSVEMHLCSDNFETIYASFPGEEVDVFIVYGDEEVYSDKTSTHYNGNFQFNHLRKGEYQIFVYSDDESGGSQSGKVPVIRNVEITKNGEELELEKMEVYDQVTNYEGSSTIKGRVFAYDYTSDMILKDSFYIRNEYVYLARQADNYYFERQRTFYDGSFEFTSLPQGNYEVYVYSRDPSQQDPQDEIPVIKIVDILENRQTVDVGRIDIID
ncbi:MAG: hypothetical protein B7C24_16925 [Bacteroidetes bacterium 4572_77]|nr:MAG: hypothetical protein B7C24_16925 [Bacteroidetes bacterium 4572_77]